MIIVCPTGHQTRLFLLLLKEFKLKPEKFGGKNK